jgi:hypothetical protein
MMVGAAEIKKVFQRIDDHLGEDQSICVIGSTASILMGQLNRNTEDIDVWLPASGLRERIIRAAVEKSGLAYNPTDDEPDTPYVQIVHPGIVQVPGFDPEKRTWLDQPARKLWQGRHLTVECPPPEVIVASKMRRFNERDVTDCIWLISNNALDAETILRAIRKLPPSHRQDAEENFSIIDHLK